MLQARQTYLETEMPPGDIGFSEVSKEGESFH